ncbi:MAG TPA: Mov34/MPN/PAD-1 family protein [Nakamurella sp.]
MPAPLDAIAAADTNHANPMPRAVHMPAELYSRLVRRAQDLNRAGLKAYGLLAGDPRQPGFPHRAVDVVVLDPQRNQRNDPGHRAAFHAQGAYFRAYEDAGFVADPTDLLRAWRRIERMGLEPVAAFHVHRRQPANFSSIDYRLHNPAFAWHLIISLRDPADPEVRPFLVSKDPDHLGIDETDDREGSELSYSGPEVTPAALVLTGADQPDRRAGRPAADPIRVESSVTSRSA